MAAKWPSALRFPSRCAPAAPRSAPPALRSCACSREVRPVSTRPSPARAASRSTRARGSSTSPAGSRETRRSLPASPGTRLGTTPALDVHPSRRGAAAHRGVLGARRRTGRAPPVHRQRALWPLRRALRQRLVEPLSRPPRQHRVACRSRPARPLRRSGPQPRRDASLRPPPQGGRGEHRLHGRGRRSVRHGRPSARASASRRRTCWRCRWRR